MVPEERPPPINIEKFPTENASSSIDQTTGGPIEESYPC